jgi:hypothetical protein
MKRWNAIGITFWRKEKEKKKKSKAVVGWKRSKSEFETFKLEFGPLQPAVAKALSQHNKK